MEGGEGVIRRYDIRIFLGWSLGFKGTLTPNDCNMNVQVSNVYNIEHERNVQPFYHLYFCHLFFIIYKA